MDDESAAERLPLAGEELLEERARHLRDARFAVQIGGNVMGWLRRLRARSESRESGVGPGGELLFDCLLADSEGRVRVVKLTREQIDAQLSPAMRKDAEG